MERWLYARYRLPYALCIGRVEAGDWASSVTNWLVFQGRYGVAPGEDLAGGARRQFEEAVAQAAQADPWLREHPPAVEWWGGQFAPASIPAGHLLVKTITTAFAEATLREPQDKVGAPARVEGMTYGADMHCWSTRGTHQRCSLAPAMCAARTARMSLCRWVIYWPPHGRWH